MLKISEDQLLKLFEKIHGKMTGSCYSELVYDEETFEPIAVACMKNGYECWRATIAELSLDLLYETFDTSSKNC